MFVTKLPLIGTHSFTHMASYKNRYKWSCLYASHEGTVGSGDTNPHT